MTGRNTGSFTVGSQTAAATAAATAILAVVATIYSPYSFGQCDTDCEQNIIAWKVQGMGGAITCYKLEEDSPSTCVGKPVRQFHNGSDSPTKECKLIMPTEQVQVEYCDSCNYDCCATDMMQPTAECNSVSCVWYDTQPQVRYTCQAGS